MPCKDEDRVWIPRAHREPDVVLCTRNHIQTHTETHARCGILCLLSRKVHTNTQHKQKLQTKIEKEKTNYMLEKNLGNLP